MSATDAGLFVIDRRKVTGKHKLDTPSGDPLRITPFGGGSEVGRSCILIEYKENIVMLDCGIHPGKTGREALPFFDEIPDISMIDLLLISHFHLDHAASLPYFVNKTAFKGRIFMTHPTKEIFKLILSDYLNVSNTANGDLLYDEKDLAQSMTKIETVDFHAMTEVKGIKFECLKAGHVLGAAMFMIQIADIKILYTGDYSRQEDRHLMPAQVPVDKPDVLIIEATYGNTTHKTRIEREQTFTSFIHNIIRNKGRCLIPVFALGRAQELLLILDEYWESKKDELGHVSIYYASALAKKCLKVYEKSTTMMSENIMALSRTGKNPFEFRYVRNLRKIEELDESEPCVVMASPGMLQNGPSRRLFDKWCSDERNGVIVPGYCVKGTLAHQITTVRQRKITTSSGHEVPLRMKVEDVSFSAHADFDDTSKFVMLLRPQQIVLVHGDTKMTDDLKQGLTRKFEAMQERKYNPTIHTPKNNDTVTLYFNKEKYARVVGSLANENTQMAEQDESAANSSLSGLIIKKKDFSYQILNPIDLSEYTQLSVVTIKQTVRIIYRHAFDILEYFVRQMFSPVSREYDPNILTVEELIQVSESDGGVSLSWDTDPLSDMLADSLITLITQIETNPHNIKYFPRTSCNHEHHKEHHKHGDSNKTEHTETEAKAEIEKEIEKEKDKESLQQNEDLAPTFRILCEYFGDLEQSLDGFARGVFDGAKIEIDMINKRATSSDAAILDQLNQILSFVWEKTGPIPRV